MPHFGGGFKFGMGYKYSNGLLFWHDFIEALTGDLCLRPTPRSGRTQMLIFHNFNTKQI